MNWFQTMVRAGSENFYEKTLDLTSMAGETGICWL